MAAVVVHLDVIAVGNTADLGIGGVHLDSRFRIELAQVGVVRPHGVHAEARTLRQQDEFVLIPGGAALVGLGGIEVTGQVLAILIKFLTHVELHGGILDIELHAARFGAEFGVLPRNPGLVRIPIHVLVFFDGIVGDAKGAKARRVHHLGHVLVLGKIDEIRMTHASSQKLQNLEIALRLVQRVDGLLTVEEALSGGNGHQLLLLEPMGRRQHDIGNVGRIAPLDVGSHKEIELLVRLDGLVTVGS